MVNRILCIIFDFVISERVCCKKQQKIVPEQLLVLGNKDPKVLNGTKPILEDHGNNLSAWNPSGPSEVPYSTNQ